MAADGQRMERELEDPAECWIDLVTACAEPDHVVRRQRVEELLQKARSSEWTKQLWLELTEDVEYGASVSEEELDITGDTDDDHWGSSDEEGANNLGTLKARSRQTARATLRCPRCGLEVTWPDHIGKCQG